MDEGSATSVVLANDLYASLLAQQQGHHRILLLDPVATLASIRAHLLGLVRHGEFIFDTTKENWALARYLAPSLSLFMPEQCSDRGGGVCHAWRVPQQRGRKGDRSDL